MPAKCDCGCGHRPAASGNKMRPVVCPTCGCTARFTRQWLSRMPTCPLRPVCGSEMDLPCLYDLLLVDERQAQQRKDYGRLVLGITQAQLNPAKAGRQHRCGGCSRYIGALNEQCGCGFLNDIRGGRNEGRYVEGGAFIKRATGYQTAGEWGF